MSCQDVNIQGLVSGAGFGGDFMYVLFCFKQQQEAEVPCSQLAKKFRTRKNKKGEGRRKKKKVAKTQVSKYVRNTAGSTSHASHEPHSQSRQPRATRATQPRAPAHSTRQAAGGSGTPPRQRPSRVTQEPGRSPRQQESRDGQWPAGGRGRGRETAPPRSEPPIKGHVGGAFLIGNPGSPMGCRTPGARPRLCSPPAER